MKAPPTTPTIRILRRGLVLQGGGAKGAFQFGVLQELHENGIQFDVISGTSIGALNGAVVAAGAWDLGNRMWSNLTMRSAFRWSVWGAIYTFFSSLGILYLGWLSTAYDSLLPVLLRRFFQVIAALPAIACFLAFNLMAEGKSRSLQVVFLVCTLAMAAGVCFVVGKRNYFTRLQMTMPAILVGPVALLADLFHSKLINFSGHPKASAFVVLLLNLSPLLLLVGFIHQRINAALLSNGPLREIVEGIVQTGLRCPLFATSASVREYVDPDDYTYTRMHPSFVYVPASESGFLPEYVRINSLKTDSEKAEALLASAALPLGIVANRRGAEKGIRFVDGGVADNTPWFPLVEALQCDEIVFVLCEPESAAKDETACTRDLWRKRDRLMRVIIGKNNNVQNHQMKTLWDFPNPIARKKVPEVVPFRDPQFWPESKTINRVVISPCHSLGNLISGTMKFDRIRAQENIKCGREAARVALAKWRLS